MKSLRWQYVAFFCLGLFALAAHAQAPAILLEACNAMESQAKRLECLREAGAGPSKRQPGGPTGTMAVPSPSRSGTQTTNTTTRVSVATTSKEKPATAAPRTRSLPAGCHVGPRGGTYTITKSGKKNYGGC